MVSTLNLEDDTAVFSNVSAPIGYYQYRTNSSAGENGNDILSHFTLCNASNSYTEEKVPSIFFDIRQELERYGSYKYGWDGYDGLPFKEKILKRTSAIIRLIEKMFNFAEKKPDDITLGPASDGTIDILIEHKGKLINLLVDNDQEEIVACRESLNEKENIVIYDESTLVTQCYWLLN
jgi:hypothetical protein